MKRNLALLGIMLLLSLSSFAQYCLLGQVTDETGTSIQGAQLCLYQDGELAGLAQSNAKGEYRIGDVPRGRYQGVALSIVTGGATRLLQPSFPCILILPG